MFEFIKKIFNRKTARKSILKVFADNNILLMARRDFLMDQSFVLQAIKEGEGCYFIATDTQDIIMTDVANMWRIVGSFDLVEFGADCGLEKILVESIKIKPNGKVIFL